MTALPLYYSIESTGSWSNCLLTTFNIYFWGQVPHFTPATQHWEMRFCGEVLCVIVFEVTRKWGTGRLLCNRIGYCKYLKCLPLYSTLTSSLPSLMSVNSACLTSISLLMLNNEIIFNTSKSTKKTQNSNQEHSVCRFLCI